MPAVTIIEMQTSFNLVLDALREHCAQEAAARLAEYKAAGEEHPTGLTPSYWYAITSISKMDSEGIVIGRSLTTGLGDMATHDSVLVTQEFILGYVRAAL